MTGRAPFLSFCNELLAEEGLGLAEQARFCAAVGYQGLELAPATLARTPHLVSSAQAAEMRKRVEGEGLVVTGLHWLLTAYPHLSLTSRDPRQLAELKDVMLGLLDLCAALGGKIMVHGSPGQRQIDAQEALDDAIARVADFFGPIAEAAAARGLTYCFEPLSARETRFINTVSQAERLVEKVGHEAFRTMIDTSAAGQSEDMPVADLIRRKLPGGSIAHIQLNDTNRGAPGTGEDPFADIIAAIRQAGWDRPLALEPFKTIGDARATAAYGAATVRAYWEAAA